ncbi:MAG: nucleotidyltransferase family protein [Candidatus Paceibacterota bacterium]|jgi:hypothetical protein
MSDIALLQQNKDIFEKYGTAYAGLFGSRARGNAHEDSDYDIVVKLKKPIGLFTFTGFQLELEDRLQKKVDLMTEASITPRIKLQALNDLKIFYGQRE